MSEATEPELGFKRSKKVPGPRVPIQREEKSTASALFFSEATWKFTADGVAALGRGDGLKEGSGHKAPLG